MAQVIIRNIDGGVVRILKEKAALHDQSLEQELRDILAHAAKLSGEERCAVASRIRAMSPRASDSTEPVRRHRVYR